MRNIILGLIAVFVLSNCKGDTSNDKASIVEYNEYLEYTINELLIENYSVFIESLVELKESSIAFESGSNSLEELKQKYLNSYKNWQKLGLYEGGSGSRFGPSLDNYMQKYANTYPCNVEKIEEAILSDDYELDVKYTIQGFPAIDYLLFNGTSSEVENDFSVENKRHLFLQAIIDKMIVQVSENATSWENTKKDFIANSQSGTNGSFSKILNGITEYYEQQIRKAKLAYPLGVFTQGTVYPADIETLYSENSIEMLSIAHKGFVDFYLGKNKDGVSSDKSLKGLLIKTEVKAFDSDDLLADVFEEKLNICQEKIDNIQGDYFTLMENKDSSLEEVYAAFQDIIILLKLEVFTALDDELSYSDSDGD